MTQATETTKEVKPLVKPAPSGALETVRCTIIITGLQDTRDS